MKSQSVCEKDFIYVLDNDDKIHGLWELLNMYNLRLAILGVLLFFFDFSYAGWGLWNNIFGKALMAETTIN